MSIVASHDSAAVSVASPERGTSLRAQALADRLIQGGDALAAFASGLSDAEWQTRLQKDGRKIGVVVHHAPVCTRSRWSWLERSRAAIPLLG